MCADQLCHLLLPAKVLGAHFPTAPCQPVGLGVPWAEGAAGIHAQVTTQLAM